jgi:hypothetical protein
MRASLDLYALLTRWLVAERQAARRAKNSHRSAWARRMRVNVGDDEPPTGYKWT